MLNFDAVAIAAVLSVLGSVVVIVVLWFKARTVIFADQERHLDQSKGCIKKADQGEANNG